MRFKTFTITYYHFPIKCSITRVLLPESTEKRRRREIAKDGGIPGICKLFEGDCSDDKKWRIIRGG